MNKTLAELLNSKEPYNRCKRIALQFPDYILKLYPQSCINFTEELKNVLNSNVDVECNQLHQDQKQEGQDQDQLSCCNSNDKASLYLKQESSNCACSTATTVNKSTSPQNRKLCILGDTSYGQSSCCIDLVASQHFQADLIIHFGVACLSPFDSSYNCEVLFIFQDDLGDSNGVSSLIDLDHCIESISSSFGQIDQSIESDEEIILISDIRFQQTLNKIKERLLLGRKITIPSLSNSEEIAPGVFRMINALNNPHKLIESEKNDDIEFFGRVMPNPNAISERKIRMIFIGSSEDNQLAQLVLRYHDYIAQYPDKLSIQIYDPFIKKFGPFDRTIGKTLSRRFFLVQKAKDAMIFGILVGTMGISGFRESLENVQQQIRKAGRKSYSFIMGKINPQKLANFPDIDVYVLVACPNNSLIDSKDFPKAIITPMELSMALGNREWKSMNYSANFLEAMWKTPSSEEAIDDVEEEDDSNAPHFSLVTGGLVRSSLVSKRLVEETLSASAESSSDSSSIVKKTGTHITLQYSSPAGELLQQKTFTGLKANKGDKVPAAAIPGQFGLARDYKPL